MTDVIDTNALSPKGMVPGLAHASPLAIDPDLLTDVKRFGATDVSACFSCGTCTAVCPLSDNDGTFPRRMIRYAQVGMKDALLSSKELWTCYHCGLCTKSCPQGADPAEFMASARRYAISSYDKTGVARTMYTKPVLGSSFAVLAAAFFALFFYAEHGGERSSSLVLFKFIPEPLIHYTGVVVMLLVALVALVGVITMVRGVARKEDVHLRGVVSGRVAIERSLGALWSALGVESVGQRRFRSDCGEVQEPGPLYRRRWFVHAATEWGFIGLLIATMSDYVLALIGLRATGAVEPVWYPVRLIGTVAGLAMLYGVSMIIYAHLRRSSESTVFTRTSDWMFLVMLWVVGASGLLVELALYVPGGPTWGYWMFLFHVSAAMELLLLLPFIKFAHVIYRPVALFFYELAKGKSSEVASSAL